MKALAILSNYKRFDGFIRDIISDSFLNEAIKELESLENRSCENCSNYNIGAITCPILVEAIRRRELFKIEEFGEFYCGLYNGSQNETN